LSNYQGYDSPYPIDLNTGDNKDDDASIIDDYFETTALPPDPRAATVQFEDHSNYTPPVIQRLVSGFQVLQPANTLPPMQIAWPDAKRLRIILDFTSTLATDFIRYAGNQNELMSPTGAQSGLGTRLYDGKGPLVIEYNGPLWIGDLTITGTGAVTWAIVTE